MPAINMCAGIYIDKTALIAAINAANSYKENDYTPKSWTPFAASLKAAIAVKDNGFAFQSAIDAAAKDLTAKTKALVKRAYKGQLQELINLIKALDGNKYTVESFKALETSLLHALNVNADLNATQAEVAAAASDLIRKYSKLVKRVIAQAVDWNNLYNNTSIAFKEWLTAGVIVQYTYALNNPEAWHYGYIGGSIGGATASKTAYKMIVGVTFPQNIKKCTIRMLRSSESPSTGGAPLAQIGTGNADFTNAEGAQSFDNTYCTGNIAQWASGNMGWIEVDYSGQARNLAGQTANLIFELVDNSDAGLAAGGYLIQQMEINFSVEA